MLLSSDLAARAGPHSWRSTLTTSRAPTRHSARAARTTGDPSEARHGAVCLLGADQTRVRPPGPSTRINEAIRAESVRLIDAEGENRGVVPLAQAQEIANTAGLDLVEVAADARPPVCRIMDYGKWRYEQEQKAKQARRHQSTITIKEIKFRPKIDPHDYATKKGHVERFLRHRDKVKITIMFRGRELLHPERGEAILLRLADELKDLAHRREPPEPRRPQHGDDAGAR